MSERTRAYLYRVATAVIGLLVAYGIVADGDGALWALLAAALLGLGEGAVAVKHTDRKTAR